MPQIYAGGVAGIETLMYGSSSASFRFNGGGIYLHGVGWGHLNSGQRKMVVEANCGSPFIVELGFGHGEAHDVAWYKRYIERYHDLGIIPKFITSNCFSKGNVPGFDRWRSFVKDFRDGGIDTPIYPIFEYANFIVHTTGSEATTILLENKVSKREDFQDIIRDAGGMVVDTAGKFFASCPAAYKTWIVDAIKWTRGIGLFTASYASPYLAGDQYEEYTMKYIKHLENADAEPDAFIIGNYRDPEPIGYTTVVGREWLRDTAFGLGHYLVNEYYREV